MLVHMTPHEVGGLQALAMSHGGSLTINPHTGLPEAGWLGKLLPTLLGGLGMMFGIPPIWMAGIVGAGNTAITGNIGKGLMAGLGAFGGASLAGAAGIGGAISKNALGLVGTSANPVVSGVAAAATPTVAAPAAAVGSGATVGANGLIAPITQGAGAGLGATTGTTVNAGILGGSTVAAAPTVIAPTAIDIAAPAIAKTGLGAIAQNFGSAAKTGLGTGILSKAAVPLAATGLISGVGDAFKPAAGKTAEETTQYPYRGPYHTGPRKAVFPTAAEKAALGSKEWNYFPDPVKFYDGAGNPVITGTPESRAVPINAPNSIIKGESQADYLARAQRYGFTPQNYAAGGKMPIQDGSFIVDARTVAELGNGSSGAGQDMLSRMGGMPIRGPGDGVSDSIHARIGGNQEARVARDEVKFGPEAVTRLGKGSHSRGTQKLYSLMDRAAKARKSAKRGQDTGLRRGLA
jgi:hypothetical protein